MKHGSTAKSSSPSESSFLLFSGEDRERWKQWEWQMCEIPGESFFFFLLKALKLVEVYNQLGKKEAAYIY